MSIELIVFLAIILVILVYIVILYNGLVALKNNVKKNWSNIDVLLKQRNSELPKLVATCQQYMQYEEKTLTEITNARSSAMAAQEKGDMPALGQAESALRLGLGKLFALAEEYPDLKASNSFLQLQGRISNLENSISDRREFYNTSVAINNTRIEQFPDVLIARLFNFKHFNLLEFSDAEKQDVNVANLFNQ